MEHLARLHSGIEGLDTLLKGGFVAGSSYLIQGRPGSGKTIFANQVAFHHARGGGRVLFATLLSESHERLFQFLSTMRFFDRAQVGNAIQYVSAFDTMESEGLDEVVKLLRREIGRQKASLMVVDGVLNARSRADSPLDTKKFIAELQGHAAFAGCTVLFLTSARIDESSPEHTMVDGVIELSEELEGNRSLRRLHLRKTRGTGAVAGLHSLEITERGIVVHPRLEAVLDMSAEPERLEEGQASSGTPDLDQMIGGGFQKASATLLIGPSGSGKSTLGLGFIDQSTLQEPGLIFGFYETEQRLKRKADAVGLGLREKFATGAVRMHWQPTTERLLDAMGHSLLRQVREGGIRRVLVDSLGAMARASTTPARHIEFFTALFNELRSLGATVIATWEIRDMFDSNAHTPALELSSLFDNLLLLRFVETDDELRRLLSVIKIRDSHYDPVVREMFITRHGLRLSTVVKSMTAATTEPSATTPGG